VKITVNNDATASRPRLHRFLHCDGAYFERSIFSILFARDSGDATSGYQYCSNLLIHVYNKLHVAYNDAFYGLLLKEPRWCSCSKLFVSHNVASFHAVIRKSVHFFGKVSVTVAMLIGPLTDNQTMVFYPFEIFKKNIFNFSLCCCLVVGHEPAIEIN